MKLLIMISGEIVFHPFTPAILVGIFIIVLLLLASALISGSEVAYFALGPSELESLKTRKTRVTRTASELIGHPDKLLATVLIANNFVNVGIVILSTWVANKTIDFSSAPILGFVIQTVLITFFLLLIGEIIPKVYATRFSIKFALFMALPLKSLEIICRPLASILIRTTNLVQKRVRDQKSNISLDELSHALELTGEELDEDETILKGIVKFGNIDVKEIMKSRVDVVAVEFGTMFRALIEVLLDSGFSRIPIYRDDLDSIVGILFIKDLLPHFHKTDSFRWQSLIRDPYFVPENKKINDLLEEFQENKMHLAIVVDEYGGTSGLVTMEDILEEIVGEISDESDDEEELYVRLNKYTYVFEAKILLNDLYKILELEDDLFESVRGEAETLAGMILELKGEIPEKGDVIKSRGFTFMVEEVDQRRISKIKLTVPKTRGND